MNLQQIHDDFWEQGYLLLEDFFAPGQMDELDEIICRQFGDDPDFRHEEEFLDKSQTEVIPWFPQNPDLPEFEHHIAAAFDALEHDSRLTDVTEKLLGIGWNRLYGMVMWSKRGTRGQAWHQDCEPDDPKRHNLNRLVYSRDISAEAGGQTVVMPGSHRMGVLPTGDPHEDLDGQVVLEPRKGSLVLLHGHTWHRVLPITGSCRFSTNFRASPQGTPADITDICVYRNMRYSFSTSSVVEERV